ncbi:MAG: 3-hydroxyacyl-CoA dehydrogenase NAD-binding domain-containing protein [Chloroflexota bacterium]
MDEVRKVCVLGAGTMGCRISLICAVRGGYDVAVYDVSGEALRRAPERQRQMGVMLVATGGITQEALDAGLARLTYTADPAMAAEGAGFLSESVTETVAVKRETHARFDKLLPAHAVMTTNTSSLLVSDIEDAVTRRDKFAALHFHGALGSLVDIMRGPKTSDETVDFLKRFARSIGEVPMVMKKEKGGYLYNTMLGSLIKSALTLAAGGYADPQDVDRAYMLVTRQPYGPFAMMDAIGLNIVHDAGQSLVREDAEVTQEQMMAFVKPYVERGELGAKTGKGFYTYPNPAFQKPGFLDGE